MRPRVTVLRRLSGALAVGLLGLGGLAVGLPDSTPGGADLAAATTRPNPVTPGSLTGYGFDQCHTPSQRAMDAWWASSPFMAVGVYLSGDSRGCREQPNLTPTWVSTQLRTGWRILPITLGPQASCNPRFPRYRDDVVISPVKGTGATYAKARAQGRAEAEDAVAAAGRLGIVRGSTIFYDLEAFDIGKTACRESSLRFLGGWTDRLHDLGYVSGFYSSAGSGIKMLDDVRAQRPGLITLPDQIWVARWDGGANSRVEPQYLRADGWTPRRRVKQYQGGHDETWGGVTINIDRNWLDLGRGTRAAAERDHCDGTRIDFTDYPALSAPSRSSNGATTTPSPTRMRAAQCLLKEAGLYRASLNGRWSRTFATALNAWQGSVRHRRQPVVTREDWMSLLTRGTQRQLKVGSGSAAVRRVQRALDASSSAYRLPVTGVFDQATETALRSYQKRIGASRTGVVSPAMWRALQRGLRS
ncbi:DUF1906 domain-containing protein [Nocardioides sp. TRM66260-LWL]|uniref:glycoside hydrolase domain-containing protein n=1 Tax=Nocardioides sp. TRM66260-LWL TaxID=2874478 RepID=UPI001CC4B341|nr:glycoside hydrolase domain-containing protein [Nocardioides sp. TRM66260-LWL]MBZ5734824.1 DUF1906 domain-containing protein [Nocardioides sp. TRM66260-LWL]